MRRRSERVDVRPARSAAGGRRSSSGAAAPSGAAPYDFGAGASVPLAPRRPAEAPPDLVGGAGGAGGYGYEQGGGDYEMGVRGGDRDSKAMPGGVTRGGPVPASAGGRAGIEEWAKLDDLGELDDMDAALDFEFDDDGNMIESEEYVRQKAVIPIMGGGGGDGGGADVEGAFATAVEVEETRAPPVLVEKIKALAESRKQYIERLKIANRRGRKREELLQKMNDELERMAKQLEEAQYAGVDNKMLGAFGAVGGNKRGGANYEDEARRKREDARRQLFSGVDMIGDDDGELEHHEGVGYLALLISRLKKWWDRRVPLQNDVRQIEARFGNSVASYFEFFRWIFMQNIAVAIISLFFTIKHWYRGAFEWTDTVNVFMPKFMFMSSFTEEEALDYAGCIVLSNLALLYLAVRKWVREDRRAKAISVLEGKEGEHKYSQITLNAWDYSLVATEVADLKYAIGEQILLALHEDEVADLQRKRSIKQDAILYTRRGVGLLLSVALQGGAAFVIIQLTITSAQLANVIKATGGEVLAPFADFIVPVAVSVLNALQPPILTALSKFEKWDSGGTQVKTLVWRLFIAKMLNMLLQIFSFAQLADPYMLRGPTFGFSDTDFLVSVRQSTQKRFQPDSYACRADQAGAGIFQLVLAEFVVSKVIALATPFAFKALARVRKRVWKKAQHSVAQAMAALLFFTQLVMNSFPWTPFTAVVNTVLLYLTFKFEVFILRRFQVKPLRPWSAKDAGGFFVKFYLISLSIAIFGNMLVLTNKTFPKTCGLMQETVVAKFGTDPWCTAVEEYTPEAIADAVDDDSRESALYLTGGELAYWHSAKCFGQCTDVAGGTKSSCTDLCGDLTKWDLSNCTKAATSKFGGVLKPGNLDHYCDYACGPWVNHTNGYAAIEEFLLNGGAAETIFTLAQEPGVLWLFALSLIIFASFKWNSLSIVQTMGEETEGALRAHIETLERQVARQRRQLDVYAGARTS